MKDLAEGGRPAYGIGYYNRVRNMQDEGGRLIWRGVSGYYEGIRSLTAGMGSGRCGRLFCIWDSQAWGWRLGASLRRGMRIL